MEYKLDMSMMFAIDPNPAVAGASIVVGELHACNITAD